MKERFQVKIENSEYDIVVSQNGADYTVELNGSVMNVSLTDKSDSASSAGSAHALIDTDSHTVDINRNDGVWNIYAAGKEHKATVSNYEIAQLKSRLGVSEVKSMSRSLKSPMPGLVLQVNVSVGDNVVAGDTLLVLEAMKMENPIKSIGDGVVSKIHVVNGDSVEKGSALIEFAE